MPWRRPDLRRDTTRQGRRPTDAMELLVKSGSAVDQQLKHHDDPSSPAPPAPWAGSCGRRTTTASHLRLLAVAPTLARVTARRLLGRFLPVQRCTISQASQHCGEFSGLVISSRGRRLFALFSTSMDSDKILEHDSPGPASSSNKEIRPHVQLQHAFRF